MKINYTAPFNTLSYGYTSYNIFKELIKLGCDIAYYPIGPVDDSMKNNAITYLFGNKEDISKFKNSPSVKIWHQNGVHDSPSRGYHLGFPIFELDSFAQIERRSMTLCSSVITCSQWGAAIVEDNIPRACHVVPLGIDPEIFKPCGPSQLQKTIFFNGGKWEIRKGHDILIECFNRAFETTDNVELWLMCDNPFLQDGGKYWIDLCKNSKLSQKIRIIPRLETQREVYEVMKKVDVGVFPSHAEGWNLELLELMSIGKHVIATNYSAHTEYTNNINCNLITITDKEPAYDGIWFHGQGSWAKIGEPQKTELIDFMKFRHSQKQEGILGINNKGIETGLKYTWANSARTLLDILKLYDI